MCCIPKHSHPKHNSEFKWTSLRVHHFRHKAKYFGDVEIQHLVETLEIQFECFKVITGVDRSLIYVLQQLDSVIYSPEHTSSHELFADSKHTHKHTHTYTHTHTDTQGQAQYAYSSFNDINSLIGTHPIKICFTSIIYQILLCRHCHAWLLAPPQPTVPIHSSLLSSNIFPWVPLHPILCKRTFDDLPEIRASDGFKLGPIGVPERKKCWLQKRDPKDIHLQRKGSGRAIARTWSPLWQRETLQNKPSLMTPRSWTYAVSQSVRKKFSV